MEAVVSKLRLTKKCSLQAHAGMVDDADAVQLHLYRQICTYYLVSVYFLCTPTERGTALDTRRLEEEYIYV